MLRKINQHKNNWLPNYFAENVQDIDFEHLKAKGVKAMMFDLDHTILRHGSYEVDEANVKTLHSSRMKVYIATNRRESSGLDDIKKTISAEGIMFARSFTVAKPSKEYYRLAVEMTGFQTAEVVMVGDRIVQDIWGANRAGLTTVMVEKFGYLKWYDQIATIPDRIIPKAYHKKYEEL